MASEVDIFLFPNYACEKACIDVVFFLGNSRIGVVEKARAPELVLEDCAGALSLGEGDCSLPDDMVKLEREQN